MRLLEDTRISQVSHQLIETSNISKSTNLNSEQPKLRMIWVKEYQQGHQSMVAKWILVD